MLNNKVNPYILKNSFCLSKFISAEDLELSIINLVIFKNNLVFKSKSAGGFRLFSFSSNKCFASFDINLTQNFMDLHVISAF